MVGVQESPTSAAISNSRIAFVLNSWDWELSIPRGPANNSPLASVGRTLERPSCLQESPSPERLFGGSVPSGPLVPAAHSWCPFHSAGAHSAPTV